jgi:hypothetical protein
MKKIQSMMLMLLVAVMGMCVQSCGSDDDNTPSGYNSVTYVREDFSTTLKFQGRNMSAYADASVVAQLSQNDQLVLVAFLSSIKQADASLQALVEGGTIPADAKVISTYKKFIEDYLTEKGFEGNIKISKVRNGSSSEIGTIEFTK